MQTTVSDQRIASMWGYSTPTSLACRQVMGDVTADMSEGMHAAGSI